MQKKWKVTFECKLHEKSLFTCLHEFCTILFTIRVWKLHHTFVKSPLFATVLWKIIFKKSFDFFLPISYNNSEYFNSKIYNKLYDIKILSTRKSSILEIMKKLMRNIQVIISWYGSLLPQKILNFRLISMTFASFNLNFGK